MGNRIILMLILTIFMRFVLSSVAISSTITLSADTITQEDRSTSTFRILSEIGKKFEYTKAGVVKFLEHREIVEAKSICERFIDDITMIRSSLTLQQGLTEDDKKYIDKSLGRMKRQTEQIIDDLPSSLEETGNPILLK